MMFTPFRSLPTLGAATDIRDDPAADLTRVAADPIRVGDPIRDLASGREARRRVISQ